MYSSIRDLDFEPSKIGRWTFLLRIEAVFTFGPKILSLKQVLQDSLSLSLSQKKRGGFNSPAKTSKACNKLSYEKPCALGQKYEKDTNQKANNGEAVRSSPFPRTDGNEKT